MVWSGSGALKWNPSGVPSREKVGAWMKWNLSGVPSREEVGAWMKGQVGVLWALQVESAKKNLLLVLRVCQELLLL